MKKPMVRIEAEKLRKLAAERMMKTGMPARDAEIVAEALVFADLRGTHSHGVMRVEAYENRIRKGGMNLNPELRVQPIKPAVALVDAQGGIGHPAAKMAAEEAIRLAGEHGIGMVGVKNSAHCGVLAYYVDMALRKNCAEILWANSSTSVIPFGGKKSYLGTNPLAFGFPGKTQSILLDMATSTVAFGKIFHAKEKGMPIPEGWAVDKAGEPTTDPNTAHALFPFGGVKGYGIGIMVEALTGLLISGVFGPHITSYWGQFDTLRNMSNLHLVIDPTLFNGEGVFAHTQTMIDELHAQPAADEHRKVLIPGEIEHEKMMRSLDQGIDIPETVYRYLTG